MMKIMTVVGARPNFMKAAPIIEAIRRHNLNLSAESQSSLGKEGLELIRHVLVHTGQHYDSAMSDSFFADLNLPVPEVHLGVGSGSHAVQTAEIMRKFEEVLLKERPDVVVVVGDVNSTLACALVAAKSSFDASGTRPLIAHVEAGLRSFDRTMPEEINRLLTDQLSDLLFVTEESAIRNLAREGISSEKVHFVGNTMIDSLLTYKDKAESSLILDRLGLRMPLAQDGAPRSILPYALLTLHRPANVDGRETFLNILEGLGELAREYPVVFPAHPRTRNRVKELDLQGYFASNGANVGSEGRGACCASNGIHIIEPLGYLNFLCLMKNAALVVTDSGGIQEETTILGIPCVTVRENTERPVTVQSGTNVIAGTSRERIEVAIQRQMHDRKAGNGTPKKWDGEAAQRIIDVLIGIHCAAGSSQQSSIPQPSARGLCL
jgi:UDP-N-acetylglucosamine 2-epimerase (non-hydrolysing)